MRTRAKLYQQPNDQDRLLAGLVERGGAERLIGDAIAGLGPLRFQALALTLYGPGPEDREPEAAAHTLVHGLEHTRLDLLAGVRLAWACREQDLQVVYRRRTAAR